jgi:hypothetical protein
VTKRWIYLQWKEKTGRSWLRISLDMTPFIVKNAGRALCFGNLIFILTHELPEKYYEKVL